MGQFVVIVNGFPRSGKDTFTNAVVATMNSDPISEATTFSSIDPVFKFFADGGIEMDRVNLTDNDRCALSEVGLVLEERYGFRVMHCVDRAQRAFSRNRKVNSAIFIYMREPRLIQRLREKVAEIGDTEFVTVLVRRPDEKTTVANASDQGVLDMPYDFVIHNDGTLDQLQKVSRLFARKVIGGALLLAPTPVILRATEMP